MIDGIIKADGTSRLMRAELPATYEEFRAQCRAGAQPLDVLFNAVGWSQLPTFLNKENLLKDPTAALFGLGADAVPDNVFSTIKQLIDSKARIATGSYVGTGTYGASNPNSLAFDFEPKLVIIARNTLTVSNYYGSYNDSALWMYGCEYVNIFNGNNNNQVPFSLSGGTLSWYSENANAQLNISGVTYKYIAIG